MKKRESQVPVQKGPIERPPNTYRTMTYPQRVLEREAELKGIRNAQTMEMYTPNKR